MNPKILVVGIFLVVGGLGGFLISFGTTPIDAIVVIVGAAAIYLGAKI